MFGKWIFIFLFTFHEFVSGVPLHKNKVFHSRALSNTNYRLPTNIVPEKYNIKLIPKLKDDFVFDGEVTIRVRVLQRTANVTIHANDIEVNSSSVSVLRIRTGTAVHVIHQQYDNEREFYIISLEHELHESEEYDIHLKYKGHHRDDSAGFYRSWYENSRGEVVWLVTTDFQPLNARRAFPCFDEPGLKAKFQLSIAREAHLHSVANMPLQRTQYSPELNLYWDIFEETPMPMSTYLVAFAVSDFVSTRNGIVSILHQPHIGSQAKYAATFSTPALRYLENYTNVPYFLSKMDEIAVPDYFWGAMENWALCVYKERYLLFAENISTSANRQDAATIIFHEFAHQWFGDLVGPKWWKYLWLNEGFATYFEYIGTAALEPNWRLDEQFVVQQLHSAFSADQSIYTHPMTVDVNAPEEVEDIFDSISYNKAGSVLRMIEYILSPPTFRRALTRYLRRMANSTAEDSDLFHDLTAQYQQEHPNINLDIQSIVKSWARQGGFPLITVNRNYNQGTVNIGQSHFLLSGPVDDNTTWWIPLTYTSQTNPNFKDLNVKEWLNSNEREKSFNLQLHRNDWVIFNIQETGFYRVNYDSENWLLIIKYLKSRDFTNIHPVNRAQLINDAFTFARSNMLSYETVLDLASYLLQETDYIAWYAAYDSFSFIINKLKGSKDYILFQNYLLELLDTVYSTLGFEEKNTDSHIIRLNRNQILTLACRLGYRNCIATATHKLDLFVQNPVNRRVEPDLQSVVYCYGLMNRGEEEWNFLWRHYINSNVSTEKYLILRALGCAGNEHVAHNYLRKLLSDRPEIREQDIGVVLPGIYNNGNGSDYVISFIIRYYNDIKLYGGVSNVISWIQSVSSVISSTSQYNKLKTFIDEKQHELGNNGESLLQSAAANIQWQERYGVTILNWIRERNVIM